MASQKFRSLDEKSVLRFPVGTPTGKVSMVPSLEAKWKICLDGWISLLFASCTVLRKELGSRKALEVIAQSWSLMVGQPGSLLSSYRKAFGIEGKGAQVIARLGQFQSVAEGHDAELIADDPERAGWRSVCIWWNGWSTRWQDGDLEYFTHSMCNPGCRNIWVRRPVHSIPR